MSSIADAEEGVKNLKLEEVVSLRLAAPGWSAMVDDGHGIGT